jgi:alkanesulfonate monooxygenase SsuD/methylene tetrahydromethanopterin reductase-like flavin-dependent oxidoreductase (luciferase family)
MRQLARRFSRANGHHVVVGTPVMVADLMEQWVTEKGADGFTVLQHCFCAPLEQFVELVVPELQRRGIFRTDYTGTTLREHLGIPVPQNRYTARRRSAAE